MKKKKKFSLNIACYKVDFLNLYFNHLVSFHILSIDVQILHLRLMLKALKQIVDLSCLFFISFLTSA